MSEDLAAMNARLEERLQARDAQRFGELVTERDEARAEVDRLTSELKGFAEAKEHLAELNIRLIGMSRELYRLTDLPAEDEEEWLGSRLDSIEVGPSLTDEDLAELSEWKAHVREAEAIFERPIEELEAEMRAEGLDPAEEAAKFRRLMLKGFDGLMAPSASADATTTSTNHCPEVTDE